MSTTSFVLVHGWGDDETAWDALRPQRGFDGPNVTLFRLPGCGVEQWQPGLHLEDIAASLQDVVTATTSPVVLVGHSIGGIVVTLAAKDLGPHSNLRGAVNIEGNLVGEDCYFTGQIIDQPDPSAWLGEFRARARSEWSPRYADALGLVDVRAFVAYAQDAVRLSRDTGATYTLLGVPRLFMKGTRAITLAAERFLVEHNENTFTVQGAGHWVMDDAPKEVADAIFERLEQLPPQF